jgi:hypothetical protein
MVETRAATTANTARLIHPIVRYALDTERLIGS